MFWILLAGGVVLGVYLAILFRTGRSTTAAIIIAALAVLWFLAEIIGAIVLYTYGEFSVLHPVLSDHQSKT